MEKESLRIEFSENWQDYELLDSGNMKKLERFGKIFVSRPDPRAIWQNRLPISEWQKAKVEFQGRDKKTGSWDRKNQDSWTINYKDLKFKLKISDFKNIGIFPEQASNWDWLSEKIKNADKNQPIKVLNLFAYTGAASVVCAKAGAEVVHVDSVRSINLWAKDNSRLNNLSEKQIHFLEDDALKFVLREIKRGRQYDGIIMDPPRFGHGLKGEIWKLAEKLPRLVFESVKLLSPKPLFFLINAYTADLSALALKNLLSGCLRNFGGKVSAGELALKEKSGGRFLPSGIFTRWEK